MIYLADSSEKSSSFGGSCTYIDDCFKSCLANPRRCQAPLEITKIQTGGIWSRDDVNNPFANYFKVGINYNQFILSLEMQVSIPGILDILWKVLRKMSPSKKLQNITVKLIG